MASKASQLIRLMIEARATMHVMRRDKDEEGFSLCDLSSCCRSPIVQYRHDLGLFVRVDDDPGGEVHCERCNRIRY